jgi:hypothetical protein
MLDDERLRLETAAIAPAVRTRMGVGADGDVTRNLRATPHPYSQFCDSMRTDVTCRCWDAAGACGAALSWPRRRSALDLVSGRAAAGASADRRSGVDAVAAPEPLFPVALDGLDAVLIVPVISTRCPTCLASSCERPSSQ